MSFVIFFTDCINVDTPETAGTDSEARSVHEPFYVQYVGPWRVGDDGIMDSITVDIYPEPDEDGDDIFIWLTERSQQDDISNENYGIRKYQQAESIIQYDVSCLKVHGLISQNGFFI